MPSTRARDGRSCGSWRCSVTSTPAGRAARGPARSTTFGPSSSAARRSVSGAHEVPQVQHHRRQFRDHGGRPHQRQVDLPTLGAIGEAGIAGLVALNPNRALEQVAFDGRRQCGVGLARPSSSRAADADQMIQEIGQYAGQHRNIGGGSQSGRRGALYQRAHDDLMAVHDAGAVGRQVVCVAPKWAEHRAKVYSRQRSDEPLEYFVVLDVEFPNMAG